MQSLRGGLVVSCQAPADSPLHHASVIAAMAEASANRGAVGIRVDSPEHVSVVHQRVTVPVIGLWKQVILGSDVYITPQFEHAKAVAEAGADIIAINATARPRPGGEQLPLLVQKIHEQLDKPVMADIDTVNSAEAAIAAGVDLLGTTLYGYTQDTKAMTPPGFDLLSEIVAKFSIPCICEGGIASPEAAVKALELGAFAVVVGTAITGIDLLVDQYCSQILTFNNTTGTDE